MDENGNLITIGGNTTPKKSDPSLPPKSTIAIKSTNFSEFAGIDNGNWVNGAVIITNVKSVPRQEQRESKKLSSKFYKFNTTKNYILKIDSDENISPSLYNTISPILSDKTPPDPPPPPIPEGTPPNTAGRSKAYTDGTIILNSNISQPENGICSGKLKDLGDEIGIWDTLIVDLNRYWNQKAASNPIYANGTVGSLGGMRVLDQATYTKNRDRVCGSKHGIGLAHDLTHKYPNLKPYPTRGSGTLGWGTSLNPAYTVTINTKKGPVQETYNINGDGNALYVCRPWMEDMKSWQLANNLTGGAAWNDDREPHHVECPDKRMPEFLYGIRNQLLNEFKLDYRSITGINPHLVKIMEYMCGISANKFAWENGFSSPRTSPQPPSTDQEAMAQSRNAAKGIPHVPWKKDQKLYALYLAKQKKK
jgi:hypothetical protein